MVSAWMAEVTTFEVVVKNPAGQVVATGRGDFEDESDPHGVSQDEADEWLEKHGYVVSKFRWVPDGSYYRAVVLPEERFREREARRRETGRR